MPTMHISSSINENNNTTSDQSVDQVHFMDILAYFKGSDEPPNSFFGQHPWILYIYLGIAIHGFILNTFLVSF
jgi:hypothetical protein